MGKGYILLNRQIENHWLWTDKPFSRGQAWIDLILMANYRDSTVVLKGKVIKVKRGQLLRSLDFLADRWGWSVKKVRRFLDQLKGQAQVTAKGIPQGTLITIENYTKWQALGQESGQAKGQAKGQATTYIQYKDKEFKKNKNNKGRCRPSLTEVKNYINEQGYEMDANAFYDYYEETDWTKKNGQPIKDWRATVRSWERRAREWSEKETGGIKYPEYKPYTPPKVDAIPLPDDIREKIFNKGGGNK